MNRKSLFSALAATAIGLTALPLAASAAPGPGPGPAPWMSVDQRKTNLDARIDAGVRSGALTTAEALRLRADFAVISSLERSYRFSGGGLDAGERADLDRRFDELSARIRSERGDNDRAGGRGGPVFDWNIPGWNGRGWTINGRWQTIDQRQAELNRRIDAGVRSRLITRQEEVSLRADFARIQRLEANYRRGGLSVRERAELDRQFDALTTRIRQAMDRDNGPGRGRGPGPGGPYGGYGR